LDLAFQSCLALTVPRVGLREGRHAFVALAEQGSFSAIAIGPYGCEARHVVAMGESWLCPAGLAGHDRHANDCEPKPEWSPTMPLARFLPVVALLVASTAALSQVPPPQQRPQPSPQDMQKVMDATMGAMVPMFAKMTEVMIEAQLKYAAMPETATAISAFKKNLYEALVKNGFTAEQALQIVIATAPPSATPGMK
jgi:hypothetical protein